MEKSLLINFRLSGREAEAVKMLSAQELRKPASQIRYILLQELERRGLLTPDDGVHPIEEHGRKAVVGGEKCLSV